MMNFRTILDRYVPMASTAWLMLWALLFSACHSDGLEDSKTDPNNPTPEVQAGEACMLIYYGANDEQSRREVADFALQQFNEAQQGLSHRISVSFRYVNVDEPSYEAAASNYMLGGKYPYIIGPSDEYITKQKKLLLTAKRCYTDTHDAPGILMPSMSSDDDVRMAQDMPFVRCLTTDGRGQLYAALKIAYDYTLSPYVFLLCDDTNKTYSRVFSAYAPEVGFSWIGQPNWRGENGLVNVKADISRQDLEAKIEKTYKDFCDGLTDPNDSCLFFNFIVATDNPEHGLIIDSLRHARLKVDPRFNQTEIVLLHSQNALRRTDRYHDVSSLSLSASPLNTDFAMEFNKRFGRYPLQGEAHFYDAVLMSLYAEYNRQLQNEHLGEGEDPWYGNNALAFILGGKIDAGVSWKSDGIRKALEGYLNKQWVKLRGASSEWNFQADDKYTCAGQSYYGLNYIDASDPDLAQKDIPEAWASSDISDEVWYDNESETTWDPQPCSIESAIADLDRELPDIQDRWALLIAGTKSTEKGRWGVNYRHQADVWNMYHLLRNHGYKDNHIIVVTEDDIFSLQLYPEYGDQKVVKRSHEADEANLYEDIPSHYHLSDITQQDIIDILNGKRSEHLPYVIESTSADNVFVYWSGHGNSSGALRWDGKDSESLTTLRQTFAPYHMQVALSNMRPYQGSNDDYKYRRFLMVIEACHSGRFISSMPPAKGMLYLSAADGEENSWADHNNQIVIKDYGTIYRFDRFSGNFVSIIEQDPTISFSHLYERLYNLTNDSHPMIYNNVNYGSLHSLYFTDFRE